MAYYIISYDQHRDKDYSPVWTALNSAGAKRILESVWFLESALTAGNIRTSLQNTTRQEDSLIVVELQRSSNWAAFKAQDAGVQWLRQHILA